MALTEPALQDIKQQIRHLVMRCFQPLRSCFPGMQSINSIIEVDTSQVHVKISDLLAPVTR